MTGRGWDGGGGGAGAEGFGIGQHREAQSCRDGTESDETLFLFPANRVRHVSAMVVRIRSAGIRMPGVVVPPPLHERVALQMMETVSRHSLVLTGVGKTTRDAFLRHFAHPHTCVGTPPPGSKPFPLWGGCPCPVFPVLFVTSSAWATKGFFFSSPRSSSEIPPRGRASGLEPCEGPVDPTQGDREWTNVEDGFSRAGSGESQPTVYLESCPVWIPSPLKAPLCAATASSGRFQRNGRLWGSAEYGTRGLSVSKDEGFSIVAPGASWHPGTLASWADKAARSGWAGEKSKGTRSGVHLIRWLDTPGQDAMSVSVFLNHFSHLMWF